jgi:hypothetical protein
MMSDERKQEMERRRRRAQALREKNDRMRRKR